AVMSATLADDPLRRLRRIVSCHGNSLMVLMPAPFRSRTTRDTRARGCGKRPAGAVARPGPGESAGRERNLVFLQYSGPGPTRLAAARGKLSGYGHGDELPLRIAGAD